MPRRHPRVRRQPFYHRKPLARPPPLNLFCARAACRCSDDEHRLASAKAKVEEDLAKKEAFLQIEEELISIDIPLGA